MSERVCIPNADLATESYCWVCDEPHDPCVLPDRGWLMGLSRQRHGADRSDRSSPVKAIAEREQ